MRAVERPCWATCTSPSRTKSKAEAIIASVHDKGAMKVPGVFAGPCRRCDGQRGGGGADPDDGRADRDQRGQRLREHDGAAGLHRPGVAYMDTAIHEDPAKICETPPWYGNYEWKRREACAKAAGVTAILGVGFDPGVVNAYARLAEEDTSTPSSHRHRRHQRRLARALVLTNFDPEINFREFTGTVYSWQGGKWQTNKMFEVGKDLGPAGGRPAEGLSDRP
jgi:hypothetical protein